MCYNDSIKLIINKREIDYEKRSRGGVMKNYIIVCPSCGGKGWISNPENISSSTSIVCPACKGSKTVMVTEADKE